MLVEPVVALVIALAVYRVARGLTSDSLFEGWRDRLERWGYQEDRLAYRNVELKGRGHSKYLTLTRGKLVDLLTCPMCLSFHGAWIALCVWTTSWPWQLGWKGWTLAFGIAGACALFFGWDAYEE